ncbi:flagellar basal body-associated protein FliL [Shewanella corallii]|uniref:Flagellar protein FliL n=1 Tax=Shewanella corallii TaxID=560080 RepID=A0ABT0N3X7_9GAMM|nr:flagellar basal body-associated protein FliL [Shewanella corallii]MCL2913134.1 flagellar basal body-associated protein FliL [Shewanella corallii]
MADELELEETEKPKGKGKLFLIIGIVVVLLGGGAAAFLMMGGEEPAAEATAGGEAVEQVEETNTGEAKYVGMPRPFLFNLAGPQRSRLVEIKVQLMVRGDDNEVTAKKHIPLIEDALLSTFSTADVSKLKTQVGKDDLRQKALLNVQNTLNPVAGKKVVEKVLFTGFVMQ